MIINARPLPRLLAALLLLLLAWPPWASGAEPLRLCTDVASPRSKPDGTGFEDRILFEALRRLGIPMRQVVLSAERSMLNADQGLDDGVYSRVSGLSRLYPNLIMVPEPISVFEFTAFTKDPALQVTGWEDLKPRSVGLVVGWKLAEANTTGVRILSKTRNEEALFAMLDKGRVEVAIAGLHSGLEIIRRKGYQGVRALTPPLARRDMYIYLHKRHAPLAPKLTQVLRQMRRDGTLERLTRAGLEAGRGAGWGAAGLGAAGERGAGQ